MKSNLFPSLGSIRTVFRSVRVRSLFLGLVIALAWASGVRACGTELFGRLALSDNPTVASNAIVRLREMGPEGLVVLRSAHADRIANHAGANSPVKWSRVQAAFDAVGAQRDCFASQLYWYTDLERAKAEARRSGKPILSLRLLGRLDEELSCANSRFFRTTLYANEKVSNYLRDHFILHWQSVRPVPHITIDFGDGRRIERTITGNSIHYLLDANGEMVDALPGLYGPRAFLEELTRAEGVAKTVVNLPAAASRQMLERYHVQRLAAINQQWASDLAAIGKPVPVSVVGPGSVAKRAEAAAPATPPAMAATRIAIAKSAAEFPVIRALSPRRAELEQNSDEATWAKIGALHPEDGQLDQASLRLVTSKMRTRSSVAKALVESPVQKVVASLQRSISEDTVRNEYLFHSKIHEWLANPGANRNLDPLNTRVYAELFLTPESDPWLGLVPDEFAAIDNGGIVGK